MNRRLAQGADAPASHARRPAVEAVIALGANLGDRAQTFASAKADLDRLPMSRVTGMAEPIESVAVTLSGPDATAPAYLNTVVLLRTRLAPTVLLGYLHAIEARHGRERGERWGDRTLDLDLIAYGDVRCDTPTLTLPHPRAAERSFVLEPWLRVDPGAQLPGVGPVAEVWERLQGEDS